MPGYLSGLSSLDMAHFMMQQEMHEEALPHFREAMKQQPTKKLAYEFGCVLHSLDLDQEEAALYRDAVCKHELWENPNQRPIHYIRGLQAQPWWEPEELPELLALEQAFSAIKEELCSVLGSDLLSRYASRAVAAGEWKDYVFYQHGVVNEEHCAECPRTVAAMNSVSDRTQLGACYFSQLMPNTHIRAHCGPTNGRLRVHLGLVVPEAPERPRIRVGDEIREWTEGKCLVFDDSFEHEVWNYGEPRVVLIMDMWHPQLTTEQRQAAFP